MNQPFPAMPQSPFGNMSSPAFPSMAPPAFPGQEQQQVQQRVVREERDSDPISVFFGKAAEAAIDTATFGIFQPDIIPDWAEQASPLATTIGNIAGSIAGFAPSFGASSVAAKSLLGAFRFTRRLQKAAQIAESVAGVTKAVQPFSRTLISGMVETGLTFAIHDAAREIVDQTKTNNPDIYEVAHKAVAGGLGGAIFGLGGKYSNYLSPVHQAVTMGATMTMAEVVTDAAAGEDVLSLDYAKNKLPQAFLTGTLVGLWNSRGWKDRAEYLENIPMAQIKAFFKQNNFLDEAGQVTPVSSKMLSTVMTFLEKGGVKEYDIFKGLSPETVAGIKTLAKRHGEAFNTNLKKPESQVRSAQGRINEMQKVTGMGDEEYRALLSGITGGKTSTKQMSLDELTFVYKEMTKPIIESGKILYGKMTEPGWLEQSFSPADIMVIRHGWQDIMAQPITAKSMNILENEALHPAVNSIFTKFNRYFNENKSEIMKKWKPETGTAKKQPGEMTAEEFAKEYRFHGSPKPLKNGAIQEGSYFSDYEYAKIHARDKARETYSDTPYGKVYAVRRGELKPTKASAEDIFGQSEIDAGASIRSGIGHVGIEVPITGHKGLVEAYVPQKQGPFKTVAKAFATWKRKPSDADELFRKAIEDPKFDRTVMSPRMNKLVDDYTMITDVMFERTNAALVMAGEKPITKRQYYMHHATDYAAMKRAGVPRAEMPQQEFMGSQGKRVGSPFNPTINPRDSKVPYMLNPREALDHMLKYDLKTIYLTEPGRILKEKLKGLREQELIDPAVEKSMINWYNTVILGQGSELTQKAGRNWNKWLETGKVGQFLDGLAAEMGANLGENPVNAMNHFLGVNISRAFLGFRPKLALRNATQFIYGHAFRSTKNTALGMDATLMERHPVFKEWWNNSTARKLFTGMAGEEEVKSGVMNNLDLAGFDMFRQSSVMSYKIDAQGNYLQIKDYITNPSYKHLGWADPEGIKLRKKTGNNNLMTAREKNFMFKELDELGNISQFDYTVLGMPMITRNAVAAPFTKLLSFPMNYTYKYLGSMINRMSTRTPLWAQGLGEAAPKIPKSIAYSAIPKHFIGLSIFAAAMEATFGIDFASVVGISYNPNKDEKGERKGLNVGVFDVRPNPTTTIFLSLKDLFSNDERTRAAAKKKLVTSVPVPYMLATKDIVKLADTGNTKGYIFYESRKPKAKKSKGYVPFPNVGGGGAFNPFE